MSVEAVYNVEKEVRVERLVKSSEEAMTKSFGKHEQPYPITNKSIQPETLKSDLESWLNDKNVGNDGFLKKAHEYDDGLPETKKTSVFQ